MLAVAVLVAGSACSPDPGDPTDPGGEVADDEPGDQAPAPTPDPPADGSDMNAFTEADDGSVITLEPEQAVSLRLADDWHWDEPEVFGPAVEIVRVDHFADPGYTEWELRAGAPGTATLTVAGEPNCDDVERCPPRTVRFDIEVVDEAPEAAGTVRAVP